MTIRAAISASVRTAAIAAFAFLSACGEIDPLDRVEYMRLGELVEIKNSPELLKSFVSGNTIWSFSERISGGHGTQVEYHSRDGRVFLWYPGNTRAVTGTWELTGQEGWQFICYTYQSNSYNPVTGERGGAPECKKATSTNLGFALRGDPFHLSSGNVPFVIPDGQRYAPGRLIQMMGGSQQSIDFISSLGEL